MSAASSIEWTDATWNPTRGCRKISPGCKHCYAETFAERFKGVAGHPYELGFAPRTAPDKLLEPLKWKKPKRIFVNSMSDLFLEDFEDEYIDQVMAVMLLGYWHTYQVLTKRAERMARYLSDPSLYDRVLAAANRIRQQIQGHRRLGGLIYNVGISNPSKFPAKWIWFGVSVEDQTHADERIPHLLCAPAAVRFLSCEPLLGPVDIRSSMASRTRMDAGAISWVIVGGESGHGARSFQLEWARDIVRQCRKYGIAPFVKQLGGAASDEVNGIAGATLKVPDEALPLVTLRLKNRKGGDMAEWPLDLRVREFPRCANE